MEKWSISESAKIYNIDNWGADLFSINKKGNMCVHPSSNSKHSIDLRVLVDDLIKRKIKASDPAPLHGCAPGAHRLDQPGL